MQYIGIVQKGGGYGRTLGFPTANILLDDDLSGIYAARVVVDGKTYFAAAFANKNRKLLEAHLLDFGGDLYGKEVSIELYEKIRETMQFENENDLQVAIAGDIEAVKRYFRF